MQPRNIVVIRGSGFIGTELDFEQRQDPSGMVLVVYSVVSNLSGTWLWAVKL